MINKVVVVATAGALLVAGCSSRPRNFAPVLSAPPADAQAYEAQWMACRDQIAADSKKGSERVASAAGGAAVGAGAGVAAGAAASGATYGTLGAAAAAGAAVLAVVPVFGLAGAWGLSKIKKTKKERAIKEATAHCLTEAGYRVDGWRVMSKKEVRAIAAAGAADSSAPEQQAATSETAPEER